MRKIAIFMLLICLYCVFSFAQKDCSKGEPIPGTEVPEEYKHLTDGQWEVFAEDKGELKNMALEGAEYDNLAIDENDDSMGQFNRAIIDEKIQSGRYK